MSPIQNKKEKTEKEKQIEAVREQVAKAEARGQFHTAHHEVLETLLKGEKKNEVTGDLNNG